MVIYVKYSFSPYEMFLCWQNYILWQTNYNLQVYFVLQNVDRQSNKKAQVREIENEMYIFYIL